MTLTAVPGGWVKVKNTVIRHWRFESGENEWVGESIVHPSGWREGAPRGWYCWVYAEDDKEFRNWMAQHCPTADVTHRFNSGDPMHTVYITDSAEAALFTLRWL